MKSAEAAEIVTYMFYFENAGKNRSNKVNETTSAHVQRESQDINQYFLLKFTTTGRNNDVLIYNYNLGADLVFRISSR